MRSRSEAYDAARDDVNDAIANLYRQWRELTPYKQQVATAPKQVVTNVVEIQEMNEGGR